MARSIRCFPLAAILFATIPNPVVAAVVDVPSNHPKLRWEGRISQEAGDAVDVSWPTTRLVLRFRGTGVAMQVDSGRTWWNVSIDGRLAKPLAGGAGGWRIAAAGLPDTEHELVLSKRTESFVGRARVLGLRLEGTSPAVLDPNPENPFGIEFVGNSITCGYGVHSGDPDEGFQDSSQDADATASAIAARTLGAQHRSVCRSGYGVIRDVVGEPNHMPGIYDRIHPETAGNWDHGRWHPNLVAVNLGTNDFARGIPDSATFHRSYADFLRHLVAVHPGVAIVLLHGPMVVDGFPYDSLGNSIPTATMLRKHIGNLLETLRPELGIPMDSIVLTPQSREVGYGGDYHPNHEQSAINGAQIATGIRRAFPALLASVKSRRDPEIPASVPRTWSGEGSWIVDFLDLQGRSLARHRGVGPGSIDDLRPPRGLFLARVRQGGRLALLRIANP